MLGSNPGVAIIRDEIGGWVAAMDQYRGGKGRDRQQYLSLWSAGTIKADRKTGDSIYVRNPVCCVVGGIQPDLASDLHNAAANRDGFVERILPVVPDVGVAQWTDDAPTAGQYKDVLELFETVDATLGSFPFADADSATVEATGLGVRVHPDALDAFKAWLDENAGLIGDAHGITAGFYSKLPAHVARFALILHALWNPNDPRPMVSAETMDRAIDLGDYFREHIARFLTLLNAAAPSPVAAIEGRIIRQMRKMRNANDAKSDGWVSRSTIYRGATEPSLPIRL